MPALRVLSSILVCASLASMPSFGQSENAGVVLIQSPAGPGSGEPNLFVGADGKMVRRDRDVLFAWTRAGEPARVLTGLMRLE